MKFHEFIGKVQNRARLGTSGEAASATRATLEVLGQRLFGGEAKHLAAQLPEEIGAYLEGNGDNEAFGVDEFYRRVSEKEGVDLPNAIHHARSVISVVKEASSQGEFDDVRAQLPDEYDSLFEADVKGSS